MLKKRYLYWFMVACWMVLLFVVSAQNTEESSSVSGSVIEVVASVIRPSFSELNVTEKAAYVGLLQNGVRMLAHYLAYCVLGILVSLAMQTYPMHLHKRLLWSLAIGVIYAVSDEIHQYFVPGRSMQISDIVIDSFGVLSGIFVARPRKTGLKTNRETHYG
jgi:VanZ family protein